MSLDPGGASGGTTDDSEPDDDAREQLTETDPGSGQQDSASETETVTSPGGAGGGFTSGGGQTTTGSQTDTTDEPDEATEQLTETDPGSQTDTADEPDDGARRQLTESDPGSRDVTQMRDEEIRERAEQAAEEQVETTLQEGLEGRAGRAVMIDGRRTDVRDQARALQDRAITEADFADDAGDVAIVLRDDRLVAVPTRDAAVDLTAASFEDELRDRVDDTGDPDDRLMDIREDVAGDIDAVDPDDVVLREDGDQVTVDFEATAERAAGEADPGLLARGVAFGARRARRSPAGAALPAVATSLRTRTGVDIDIGPATVPLPGRDDVDQVVESLEPADEAFKGLVERGTAPAEFASRQIDERMDVDTDELTGVGAGRAALLSPTVREGAISGVETGAQALSPAAIAQDATRIADLGVRGIDRAARDGSEEQIEGALQLGGALAGEAADRAPSAAVGTAVRDPSRAVEIPVAVGTAGVGGAVLGTGAAAAPRAARAGARAARDAPRRVRHARRGFDDEVAAFREDTRGMASGERMLTRQREETVEIEATRGERVARELDVEDFESPDDMAREQAMLVERERMPPRSAFASEEEFQSTLTARAARRLDIDEDEFAQARTGQRTGDQTVEAVAQQEVEGFAAPALTGTVGATGVAAREVEREDELFAAPPASLEDEVAEFEVEAEATVSRESVAEAEVEATIESTTETTLETQALDVGLTTDRTVTRERALTSQLTGQARSRARRSRRFDLPEFDGDDGLGTDPGGDGFAREFEFGVASPDDVLAGGNLLDDS